MRDLREAVRTGDADWFRAELFGKEPGVVSLKMAEQLRFGFVAPKSTLDQAWSLAELCFHENRPELLRIALQARRPEMVDGLMTDSNAAWRSHLCTRHVNQQFASVSMVGIACWDSENPAAEAFIDLGVEFDPDDVEQAEDTTDEEGRALIRAARLRLHVRLAGAALDQEARQATTAAPQRRSRVV